MKIFNDDHMTDKQVFERFMSWMGMEASQFKEIDGNLVIEYEESKDCDSRFTTQGYDEFYSGAIFDSKGNMIKGYMDSHVAWSSNNCDYISRELNL